MSKYELGIPRRLAPVVVCCLMAATPSLAWAQSAQEGSLQVPAKSVPVPSTVSPQLAKIIGMPLRNGWDVLPKTGEEWTPIVQAGAAVTIKNLPGMRERLHVKVEKTMIDGVRAFIVTPETIRPQNQNRVLLHMHGGCYVLNPGELRCPRPCSWPASAASR